MRRTANPDGEGSHVEMEPLTKIEIITDPSTDAAAAERTEVPVGYWKDSLWDLFRFGPCHVTVWTSCCCVPIAAGQVISRLKLSHWGLPTNDTNVAASAFRKLVTVALSFWITRIFFLVLLTELDPNVDKESHHDWDEPGWIYHILVFADNGLAYGYMGYTGILLWNLRSHVRSRYSIPDSDQCPAGVEDICCSLCCSCFVVGQMLRHTAEYETYGGRCCTSTGLPGSAPSIV